MTHTLDASLDASLDDVIDRALSDQRIVGTVVLVARGGDLVYARAAGDADRERGLPMALETVFRLASVTKPIVAAAALAMVERGDLALDGPHGRVVVAVVGVAVHLAVGDLPQHLEVEVLVVHGVHDGRDHRAVAVGR